MYNNFRNSSIPIPAPFYWLCYQSCLNSRICPTIISVILAGKVGSYITLSIGTMRVTEQIDALDIMGVNSANFFDFTKILASVIFNPLLIAISMVFGIWGGHLAGIATWESGLELIIFLNSNVYATILYLYAFLKTAVLHFLLLPSQLFFAIK